MISKVLNGVDRKSLRFLFSYTGKNKGIFEMAE